jgi:3-hydroxy acid dehydrogenase / malonic semialdehyde reductase
MDLVNRVVFITGASSGIGAACAHEFAKKGACLILAARRFERVSSLAQELNDRYGVSTHPVCLDVTKEPMVRDVVHGLKAPWSDIDILINNAGLAAGLDKVYQASISDIDAMVDTNIKGLLYVSRYVVEKMVARGVGHVINIGSIAGHQVYPKGAIYCATKFAVRAISEGLKLDLHGTPIRVSEIDPGQVDTEFSSVRFKGDVDRARDVYAGVDSLHAQDIANTVLFCATQPAHVNIGSMVVWPTDQSSVYLLNRRADKETNKA